LSGSGIIPSVLVAGLICALAATGGRGDDAKKGREKGKFGRIIVRADQFSTDIPTKAQFHGLLSVDPETGDFTQLGDCDSDIAGGRLSHGGRSFVAIRPRRSAPERAGVWVYDVTGKTPPRRVFERFGIASWSDDGTQIVIGSPVGPGKYETYRVSADGKETVKLPIPEGEYAVDCSRDGSWLLCFNPPRGSQHRARICLMRQDGTESDTVLDIPGTTSGVARISQDGRKVVYTLLSTAGPEKETRTTLWVVDSDGENREQVPLEFEPGTWVSPVFSPDGSRLALNLPKFGSSDQDDRVEVVDLDGKNMRRLPLPPWKNHALDWK
jgi:Tol biopolymer transport system component